MNYITVKDEFPENVPKGSKCYKFLEEVVYEQISKNAKKPQWVPISTGKLTLQFLVSFLMNTSENSADLTNTILEQSPSSTGSTQQNPLMISNMI